MTNEEQEIDFLEILSPGNTMSAAEVTAELEYAIAIEKMRVAAVKAEMAAAAAAKKANACPKCSGRGYLPQFQHRKGGECFTCGGTGIFTRLFA